MRIVYAGVMGGTNGFTKAMATVCNEFIDVPMANVNAGLQAVQQADLVFLQPQDKGISTETLQHLKRIGAFVINWTGDARDDTPAYCFEYAQFVDLTCFSNMRDVKNMRLAGRCTSFLQIGYDPAIYHPDEAVEKDIDIVFMGNNSGHFPLSGMRMEMVRELKRVYGDRFKAYGGGMPDGNFMGNQTGEAAIYRRAKIGINLSHYNYERYTSDRLFRMLGSGVCVLSHNYWCMENDFDSGTNICVWENIEDLKKLINHVLNPLCNEGRASVANRGHQKALERHTFECMAKDIVELYKNR